MRIFLVIFATLFSVLAQAEKVAVVINEKSTARLGAPVRLGDIADLSDVKDVELSERLFDASLYPAVTEERTIKITGAELATSLRQKLSFQDLQKIALKIPETAEVGLKRNFISETEVALKIRNVLSRQCQKCEVVVEDLFIPEVKTHNEILGFHFNTASIRPGSTAVPMEVQTSRGPMSFWVTAKTALYTQAPVATRLIRSGEKLQESDFTMNKINITFAKDAVADQNLILGQVANRTLNVGQSIYKSDLRVEPAVRRGESVKLVIGAGELEITSSGVAEDQGYLGEVVRVKNNDTQKIISGVLVEKGVVRIR